LRRLAFVNLPTDYKIPARQIIWRAFVLPESAPALYRRSARVERAGERNGRGNGRSRKDPPVGNVSRRIRGNGYRFDLGIGFLGHLSSP
jgi:hypothetical protein